MGDGQGRGGMGGAQSARLLVDQRSVDYLVAKATDLELTADQTAKLEAIGARRRACSRSACGNRVRVAPAADVRPGA